MPISLREFELVMLLRGNGAVGDGPANKEGELLALAVSNPVRFQVQGMGVGFEHAPSRLRCRQLFEHVPKLFPPLGTVVLRRN